MYYGNNAIGYGYSPNRSYDIDRFNHSTSGNYPTTYNTNGYYSPTRQSYNPPKVGGKYLGNGQYVED